jgi:hypothetical protein
MIMVRSKIGFSEENLILRGLLGKLTPMNKV